MRRRRFLKRAALGIIVLLVLCAVTAFVALRSRAFHRYVLTIMINRAEQAVGGKVLIGDFVFHPTTLRLDFYRVTISGKESGPHPPLLFLVHAGVNLKIISLLERKINVRRVVIDDPVVHLTIDKNGQSNLPHSLASKVPGAAVSVFNLAVGHFLLRHGEVNFNDRQIPLEANLRRLRTHITFNALLTEYGGVLDYRAGDIDFGRFKPFQHRLYMRFSANPGEMRIDPLVMSSGASQISIHASIKNYSHPGASGFYTMALSAPEMARIFKSATVPQGRINTSGTFLYQYVSGQPLLDALSLDGRVTCSELRFRFQNAQARLSAVAGRYSLQQGELKASRLKATVFGGQMTAEGAIRNLAKHPQAQFTASFHSLSLASIRGALLTGHRWARFPINGSVEATAQVSWHDHLAGLRVQSDATLSASIAPSGAARGEAAIPLQAAIQGTYDADAQLLTLDQAALRMPRSEVDLSGGIGRSSAVMIRARTQDLHQAGLLIGALLNFAGAAPGRFPFRSISGAATFNGTLRGKIQSPTLTGQLMASGVKIQRAVLTHVQAHIALSSSQMVVSQAQLRTARGRVQFQASLGLRHWTYKNSSPLQLQLTATNMQVADLESLLDYRYPLSGILSARVSIHGSELHPAGDGDIHVVNAQAWSQPIRSLDAHFHGTGDTVQSTVAVQTTAGAVHASLAYSPRNEGYDGRMTLQSIRLQRLKIIQEKFPWISGVATGSVRGRGTLKSPELRASFSIPNFRVARQMMTGVSAQAEIANRVATLTLNSNLAGASFHAGGTVQLHGNDEIDATIDAGSADLGPLLANVLPEIAGNIHCQTEAHGWIRGPLKARRLLKAHLDVSTLRVSYRGLGISNSSPISADLQNGDFVLHPAELKGTGAHLYVQAAVSLQGTGALHASASGTADLHLLQILYPEWDSSGELQLNLTAGGSRSHPVVAGQMHVVNAAIEPPNSPIGVENMNSTIALTPGRAHITYLTAEAGGGSVTGSGFVSLEHGVQFDLGLKASHVRVRYPQGVREVLDGNLALAGTYQSALISGRVSIRQLSLTPSFDLTRFSNQLNTVTLSPASGASFAHRTRLNVTIRASEELGLNSSQLNLRGSASLRATGTLSDPVFVGDATLSGGEVFFNGRRFRVESGVIDFVNPVMTEPVVNIQLTTTADQYNLTLHFSGPFDRLRTTYTSDPPLAPVDIINLLLTGQPAEAKGTGLGAQSILAQGLTSNVSNRVQKLIGVSSLTIDPETGGNGTNPGARIAVQERVTKNLFFTFSVDVATTQDDIVQLEYQLSRRWSVEAIRHQDGGYSLEIKANRTF